MLIAFRVRNFGCLLDEQELSFVPAEDKEGDREGQALLAYTSTETTVPVVPRLLRTAVIYGANAGGKSTVLEALQTMLHILTGPWVTPAEGAPMQQVLPYTPFALSADSLHAPTLFEITFLFAGRCYQYGFQYTKERICKESLYEIAGKAKRLLFSRKYDSSVNKDIYTFGKYLRGSKAAWSRATRETVLFLSRAEELNSAQLGPVYEHLISSFVLHTQKTAVDVMDSLRFLSEDEEAQHFTESFLDAADLGISKIAIQRCGAGEIQGYFFVHAGETEALLPLEAVSGGTVRLLSCLTAIYSALKEGQFLGIDALDRSLHPLLVQRLVKLFHSAATNPHGAQLLCTLHDIYPLQVQPPLFRKDQIWFVDKKYDRSSELYSLAEFKGAETFCDLDKRYLQGLFGGIPLLR